MRARNREPDSITKLLAEAGAPPDRQSRQFLREMIMTVLKLAKDNPSLADLKLLNAAFKEMRTAFKVFAPYRNTRKVSTFGSARTGEKEPSYRQARKFSRQMAEAGFMVLTGAGDGIMRACQEGAGREKSFGINIRLPFEQRANEFIDNDHKLVNFKYFFTRKLFFLKEADAVALFPGGFGTSDEGFEALTLVQTGKTKPIPVVFIDAPHGTYWKSWKRYVEDHLLRRRLISPEDMKLFIMTNSVREAVEEITGFYRVYHSSRYVGDQLVIRLNRRPDEALIRYLNQEFADIIAKGAIELMSALPEEDEPEIAQLPRLVFSFNRFNFGRLRELIDRLNDKGVHSHTAEAG